MLLVCMLVFIFVCVSFVHGDTSRQQIDEIYSNIVAMRQHVQLHYKNHELRQSHKSCLNDVDALKARLSAQLKTQEHINADLEKLSQDIDAHQEAIDELSKTYKDEHALWLKQKKPEENDINEQIAAIEAIKRMALQLSQKNPKHKPVVDKIIVILDDILKHLRQRFQDLQDSPVLERLNHKIQNAKERLVHLNKILASTKTALANANELIASLRARINDMTTVCTGIGTKLTKALAALEKDLKMLQRIVTLIDKLRDEQDAAPTPSTDQEAHQALDYGKIESLIKELTDIINKEFLALENPKPTCDQEKEKLNAFIHEKTNNEKDTAKELAALQSQLGTKEQDIASLIAQYAALEGQLKAVTAECEILGQNMVKDKDLLDEIAAIAQIMQLVHDLNTKKDISDETSTKMTTLLQRIKDELLALIEAKLKKAQDSYAQCKVHRGDLMIKFEKEGKELHNLRVVFEDLQQKIKESDQMLKMIREDKKSLVDLLSSSTQKCAAQQSAYDKLKAEHEEDLKILDTIVNMLKSK